MRAMHGNGTKIALINGCGWHSQESDAMKTDCFEKGANLVLVSEFNLNYRELEKERRWNELQGGGAACASLGPPMMWGKKKERLSRAAVISKDRPLQKVKQDFAVGLNATGRITAATVRMSAHVTPMVYCVYGDADDTDKANRVLAGAFAAAFEQDGPAMIGGDFNVVMAESHPLARAAVTGWTDAHAWLAAKAQTVPEATHKGRRIDQLWVNEQAREALVGYEILDGYDGHSPIIFEFNWDGVPDIRTAWRVPHDLPLPSDREQRKVRRA
jgi:hypothetical protein